MLCHRFKKIPYSLNACHPDIIYLCCHSHVTYNVSCVSSLLWPHRIDADLLYRRKVAYLDIAQVFCHTISTYQCLLTFLSLESKVHLTLWFHDGSQTFLCQVLFFIFPPDHFRTCSIDAIHCYISVSSNNISLSSVALLLSKQNALLNNQS